MMMEKHLLMTNSLLFLRLNEMIINSTKLLQLLAKAQSLNVKYEIQEVSEDEHEIHIFTEGTNIAVAATYTIHVRECKIGRYSDFETIDGVMKYLDVIYTARVREQKRKALLDKLTDEEKELLGVK